MEKAIISHDRYLGKAEDGGDVKLLAIRNDVPASFR